MFEEQENVDDHTESAESAAAAVEEAQETAEEEAAQPSFAILFELDNLIGNARYAAFEVLSGILKEKNITFTGPEFARYCLFSKPQYYIEAVQEAVGAKKLSTAKLIEDVESGIGLHLSSAKLDLPEGLKKIMEKGKARGIEFAAVSCLPPKILNALTSKLDLQSLGIKLFTFKEVERHFPRADAWLRVAKEMEIDPRSCLVLGTSQYACKSALTAGMRTVAVPDQLTGFQDYGGSLMVVDNLDEIDLEELFEYLPE
ncbi:MAG: beta-phosphoglucomutase-like phosphatase (HAD superfamily) [Kiritimatiellia bacterium]|jgi:beta-phosphoglucomutase-like phosphatase (HAD superfamily)